MFVRSYSSLSIGQSRIENSPDAVPAVFEHLEKFNKHSIQAVNQIERLVPLLSSLFGESGKTQEIEKKQGKQRNHEPIEKQVEEKPYFRKRMLEKHSLTTHLFMAINTIEGNTYTLARQQFALVLLFVTGLRVANLLLMQVHHATSLVQGRRIRILLVKSKIKECEIQLNEHELDLITKYQSQLDFICKGKQATDPLFTSQRNKIKCLNRSNFDNELNKALKRISSTFGTKITTYTFRASKIKDHLQTHTIDEVQEKMGHADIKTTAIYKKRVSI